jgi:hypothetical protein
MRNNIVFLIIAGLVLSIPVFAKPPLDEGKSIFMSRCAACHNINKVLTGPALAGIHDRRSIEWIVSFVRSSSTMIAKGDKDAIALFEKFNKIPMPDHSDLSEESVKSIVEFIKSESTGGVAATKVVKPGKKRPAYAPPGADDYGKFIAYFVAVGMLIAVLLYAAKVKALMREKGLN